MEGGNFWEHFLTSIPIYSVSYTIQYGDLAKDLGIFKIRFENGPTNMDAQTRAVARAF